MVLISIVIQYSIRKEKCISAVHILQERPLQTITYVGDLKNLSLKVKLMINRDVKKYINIKLWGY